MAQIIFGWRGFKFVHIKGHVIISRGNNYEIAKIQILNIFFSRTTGPIWKFQYLSVYCTLTLHQVLECTLKRSELSVQDRTHHCKQKLRRKLECCRQVTEEVMICIANKYELIKFTNFYQINHNLSYFSTKTSNVTGSSIIILRKHLK